MTGREAVNYILANWHDDCPLVIQMDGKTIDVFDIDYELSSGNLVVIPDMREPVAADHVRQES